MEKELLQYGPLGIMVIGMAWFILYMVKDHRKERKEWREFQEKQTDRMMEQGEESNKVIRDHSNLLSGIKSLLENRRYDK